LVNGVANLLLLVKLRVIAGFATQNYRAAKRGWRNLRCEPFPPHTERKPASSKSAIKCRIFRGIRKGSEQQTDWPD